MLKHKTTVLFPDYKARTKGYRGMDEVSAQVRFFVRQAVALAGAGIPYTIEWGKKNCGHFGGFGATLTVENVPSMPTAKPLPKEPKIKLVGGWKPKIWDAEYRLEAWLNGPLDRKTSGMVIAHSCGLALVKPYASEEWDASEDITKGWRVTHIQSGLGLGMDLNFNRATAALLLMASECDWSGDAETFKANPAARRAYRMAHVQYGDKAQKQRARYELERAA